MNLPLRRLLFAETMRGSAKIGNALGVKRRTSADQSL